MLKNVTLPHYTIVLDNLSDFPQVTFLQYVVYATIISVTFNYGVSLAQERAIRIVVSNLEMRNTRASLAKKLLTHNGKNILI